MPAHYASPKTGAFSPPGSLGGVFQSFDVTESQALEEVTCFGAGVYGQFRGNGTPIQSLTVSGFVQTGASNANPGFGITGAACLDSDGGTATLTFETATTLSGDYIVQEVRASVSRVRGAESATWTLRNATDISPTWAAS